MNSRLPEPAAEIIIRSVQSLQGANFWSPSPVTRLDMSVGAFDDISSADVAGFTEQLVAALPGLVEHRCNVGERGGFVTRLRRGTYAPHIVEHVALELQTMIGHDVGFGRARGGDEDREYTVVFEHVHAGVGRAAALTAVDIVVQTFAGNLDSADAALDSLRSAGRAPDLVLAHQRIKCGIVGSGDALWIAQQLGDQIGADGSTRPVIPITPAEILQSGLPYHLSDIAVIAGTDPGDVPPRYRETERALQLLSVVADGTRRQGLVVAPDHPALVELIATSRRKVATFGRTERTGNTDSVAHAFPHRGGIRILWNGAEVDGGTLRDSRSVEPQLAAALARQALLRT